MMTSWMTGWGKTLGLMAENAAGWNLTAATTAFITGLALVVIAPIKFIKRSFNHMQSAKTAAMNTKHVEIQHNTTPRQRSVKRQDNIRAILDSIEADGQPTKPQAAEQQGDLDIGLERTKAANEMGSTAYRGKHSTTLDDPTSATVDAAWLDQDSARRGDENTNGGGEAMFNTFA